MSLKTKIVHLISFIIGLLINVQVLAAQCPSSVLPQKALTNYLEAMQERRFTDAFKFVSNSMTDGRSNKDWAELQEMFYIGGGVIIFGIDVRQAIAIESDADCSSTAIVPNILRSRDNFNNQGITEFELYTIVRIDGRWLVDSQETLFDQPDVDKWFPGETIPEFLDKK
jgi:hypothetical protein